MDERDVLAERFDAERGRLRTVAYRMLGSLTEAEDAVQEAWLRLARSDNSAIENLSGWPVRRSRNGSASNNGNALRP
jgi:RNA polymerase sigma-70 factor (ECF subfamily)